MTISKTKNQSPDIDEQWQLDLADVSNLKKQNDGFTFLLYVIDVLSKYAWVVPLKQKTGKEMIRELRKIFQKDGRRPICIQLDQGKEFTNQKFLKAFKSINFFTTRNTDTKASILERFQRTLKACMWRYFTRNKTRRYVDILSYLFYGCNNFFHWSFQRAPVEVNCSNVLQVWKNLYGPKGSSNLSSKKPRFRAGDVVCISKAKKTFEKGYLSNWTTELFTVSKRIPDRYPCVYKIQDYHGEELEGTFCEKELKQVVKKDGVYEVQEILAYIKRRVGKKVIPEEKCVGKDIPRDLIHGFPSRISYFPKDRSLENVWRKCTPFRNSVFGSNHVSSSHFHLCGHVSFA